MNNLGLASSNLLSYRCVFGVLPVSYFLVFWILAGSFWVSWIIRSKLSSGADLLGIILPHFVHLCWITQPFLLSWVAETGSIRDLQVLWRSPGVSASTCSEYRHLRQ